MVRMLVDAWVYLIGLVSSGSSFTLLPPTGVATKTRQRTFPLFLGVNNIGGGSEDVNFARRVVEKVHPSVALVTPVGVRNMTMQGTGFVVDSVSAVGDEVYLLTAAHVAAPGYDLIVKFPGSKTSNRASVVARDVPTDLALIRIDVNQTRDDRLNSAGGPLKLADGEYEDATGSLVFANGYSSGITGGPAITMGIICAMAEGFPIGNGKVDDSDLHANTTFVVTDAAMAGGMSGGPLVDIDGRVWGVNALVRPDMRALGNYAISAKTCREFLDNVARTTDRGFVRAKEEATGFRVVLFNDPMNKRERVARILREVAQLNETRANDVMMKAHTTGSGVVKVFPAPQKRKDADVFCQALREQDVLAEVEEMVS